MKSVIIGIIVCIVVLSGVFPVFAEEGFLQGNLGRQIDRQPTICLFEPADIELSKSTWNTWVKESQIASDEWENRLKSTNSHGKWEITWVEIPKDKLQFVNYSGCDLKIHFVDSDVTSAKGWYDPDTKDIVLIRNQMTFCGKVLYEPYNFYVNSYCRGDDLERAKKMANTLKHELGHAFGLGHYVSTNSDLMQDWYNFPLGAPSIMAIYSPDNEQVRDISLIDLQTIGEIHGSYGFGKEKNPDPVFVYPEVIITEPTVSGIQNIQVTPYKTSSTKIEGSVPDKLFSRGIPVEIEITNPDGTKHSAGVMVSKHRSFEYPMIFSKNSMLGTYEILFIYKGEYIQKNQIILSTSSQYSEPAPKQIPKSVAKPIPEPKETVSIPTWIKNNVKWWSEGAIDDKSFTSGIEFLITDGVIDVPITQKTVNDNDEIPLWVRTNANWWADGLISDSDFVKGIEYLVNSGIIKVAK